MDSEQCLNVFVGCPPLLRKLPDGPCLLLDADQDVLDAFQAQYPTKDHKDFVCLESKVLAAPDDGSVIWRRFSDSRFNGVWNLRAWLEIAPNLRELDQYSVHTTTFSSVLEQSTLSADSWDSIRLFLRQGDPVQILKGAGELLKSCTSILLRYPGLPLQMEHNFAETCSAFGFEQVNIDDNAWVPKRSEWSEVKVLDLVRRNSSLMDMVKTFFDASSYRQICSDLDGLSDSDLLEHWLNSSDPITLIAEMRRRQRLTLARFDAGRVDPILEALRSLFPFEFYRSLRPDLSQLDDNDLMVHYCDSGLKEGIYLEEGVEMQYAIEALRKIFPYEFYRMIAPDLSELSDHSLLIYFCAHDLKGGVDLSERSVRRFIGSYPASEIESLRVRVKELEAYLDAALNHAVRDEETFVQPIVRKSD